MTLIVAPLRRIHDVVASRKPSHVLTLVGPEAEQPVCVGIAPDCHLTIRVNDITAAIAGLIAPAPSTVQSILNFADTWDRKAPMLVHCFAGISRSTAAAYIIACSSVPKGQEHDIAARLRTVSPTATPNILMVALADNILGRDGAMVAAIKRIGRGTEAMEGVPFDLAL